MKGTILLNHNENTKQVEDEEKQRFLRTCLEQMQVPIEDFWAADGPLSIEQTIKLRSTLNAYRIQVIDDLDGHMQIFFIDDSSGDYELIGEWNKCTYKLKRDLKQRDPRKQLYLEMQVNCWTLFEEQETPET